jgi:transcriptional regulator of NAD metabolism
MHNKGITDKLDAWLTFLSMDSPEVIVELIERYPEFRAMYEHIYNICRNVEGMMEMYSEELKILDRNTVKYMVDQMQEQIDSQKELIDNQKEQLVEKEIQELKRKLAERK